MDYTADEIDIKEIFLTLWAKKHLIALFTVIAFLVSVIYSRSLQDVYTSTALLAPQSSEESLSSQLGGYSALAGMAGINVPLNSNTNPSIEAIELINSFNFFSNNFFPYIKLENLLAVEKWDSEKNLLAYDESQFNSSKNAWLGKYYANLDTPSKQKAYKVYKEILSITHDKKTNFVKISIDHQSPHIAKNWLDLIIKNINESMKNEEKRSAESSMQFLQEAYKQTTVTDMKNLINELMSKQMQRLMLASANEDFIFKKLDPPIAPETKSSPDRVLIVLFGTVFAIFFVSLIIILRIYFSFDNKA